MSYTYYTRAHARDFNEYFSLSYLICVLILNEVCPNCRARTHFRPLLPKRRSVLFFMKNNTRHVRKHPYEKGKQTAYYSAVRCNFKKFHLVLFENNARAEKRNIRQARNFRGEKKRNSNASHGIPLLHAE